MWYWATITYVFQIAVENVLNLMFFKRICIEAVHPLLFCGLDIFHLCSLAQTKAGYCHNLGIIKHMCLAMRGTFCNARLFQICIYIYLYNPYIESIASWNTSNSSSKHLTITLSLGETTFIEVWKHHLETEDHFYRRPPLTQWVLSSVIASIHPSVCLFVHLSVCPSVRPKQCSHSNSLRIIAISLKFYGMMHSTMKHIVI